MNREPIVLDEVEREIAREIEKSRPTQRGECKESLRPCPYMSCRHHLFLNVSTAGSISETFLDRDLDEIPESCSLDVADRGGHTLEEISKILGITRERARQIEDSALKKVKSIKNLKEEYGD